MATRMKSSAPVTIECAYLGEPLIAFGQDGRHVDPKSGIARYGPRSLDTERHPSSVRVGVIGTGQTIELAKNWLDANARGVSGDAKHLEFPGFASDRGFYSELRFDSHWMQYMTQSELGAVMTISGQKERFESMVALLAGKLRLLSEQDQPPQYVLLGLPSDAIKRCGSADYHDRNAGSVHRDLRRALKAAAMKYRIPTQIMRQPTLEGKDGDHSSKIAWNLFTGLYYKAGGVPWAPTDLTAGTCYVGVSFFRPLGSNFERIQTSLVQAFDEHGEGLVLRGLDFEWDSKGEGSRAPHLTEPQAEALISMVLERYRAEMKQSPSRVVVHKTSRYWPAERAGFDTAIRKVVDRYDLVALEPQSDVRLIPVNKYPPLRGTRFTMGDLDFLYSTGFISELGEFHGVHVPSPIRVADHVGQDTTREALLREILTLTKLNWNSSHLGGLMPVTLTFSRWVGEILRELPNDQDPLPQFKFYM